MQGIKGSTTPIVIPRRNPSEFIQTHMYVHVLLNFVLQVLAK